MQQTYWLEGFLAFFYLLAILNGLRVAASPHSASTRMAWIVFHAFLPFIAVPLYYLFGQNRILSYIRTAKRRAQELHDQHPYRTTEHKPLVECGASEEHRPFASRHFRSYSQAFSRKGLVYQPFIADLNLLIDGDSTFANIFQAIEQAQSYILVQYYIIRSDRLGIALKDLLIQRAKAGIDVYLLFDDMGSFWLPKDYVTDLTRAGVRVARFLPITSFRRATQINFRNHRKLVIIDGQTAFTGGLNVGDEYVGKSSRYMHWRDTHLKLAGSGVAHLEDIFIEDWHFATQKALTLPEPDTVNDSQTSLTAQSRKGLVQTIPTGPTDKQFLALMLFMSLIQSAESSIWIATPYLIPDRTLIRELELAMMRGVKIKILLPARGDRAFVHWVSLYYAELLSKQDVEIFLYKRGFMHQKVIVIDEDCVAIGTTNLDNRAIFLNFETTLVVHGKAFSQDVRNMLKQDFEQSTVYRASSSTWLRKLIRLRANLARLMEALL